MPFKCPNLRIKICAVTSSRFKFFDAQILFGTESFSANNITATRDQETIGIMIPDPGLQLTITQAESGSRVISLSDVPLAGGYSGFVRRILRLPVQLIGMQQIRESQADEVVSRPENVTNPPTDIGEFRIRTGLGFGPDPFALLGASWIYTFRPLLWVVL